jgi:transposase
MVLLSAAGWSPPRIAGHLGCYPQTVRNLIHDFGARGTPALYPGQPGPAPDAALRERVSGRLRELLAEDRTWTAAQLADALRPDGVAIGPRQVRRYLAGLGAGYRRTAPTLEHKQDGPAVERAKVVLGNLEKKRRPGG